MNLFRISITLLIALSTFIISCEKDGKGNTTAPPEPVVNLSGQEFIFNNLEWIDTEMGTVFCHVVDQYLFKPSRPMNVAIKLDTSSVWLDAVNMRDNINATGFRYYVSNLGNLSISPNPPDMSLAGRRVSIRVRFI